MILTTYKSVAHPGLTAAGLDARVESALTTRYIVAAVSGETDHAENIEVIVDDDGYTELKWWNKPDTTPAQITALIASILTTLTTPPAPHP